MKKITRLLLFIIVFTFAFLILSKVNKTGAVESNEEIYHIVTTVTEDPSKSMMVNYHSKKAGSYVLYTTSDDTAFEKAIKVESNEEEWSTEGMTNASTTSTFSNKRYVCTAKLENLEERTSYIYKVVSGEYVSNVNSFTTAGLTNTWNFVSFADFQYRRNTITHQLIKNMKEIGSNPALMIGVGDIVDVADNEDEWTHIIDNKEFSDFIYATSPGDHEYWGDEEKGHPQWDFPYTYVKMLHYPENGAKTSIGTSYYFLYNNVLFISLDMNNSDVSTGSRFQDEIKWFKEVMGEMEGKYQYSVVFMHKSIFGSEEVDSSVSKNLRPLFYPLFQTYNVDLVLSGHDHIYSRTYQLNGNKKSTNPLVGTYYLDLGSSGDKRRNPDSSLVSEKGYHEKVIDLEKLNYSAASNIKVTDTEMTVTVYNEYKKVLDEFTIKAKRGKLDILAADFNKDEFVRTISFDSVSVENGIATLKLSPSQYSKYVQNITLVDSKGNAVLDKAYNNTSTLDLILRDLSENRYKVKITLVDGKTEEAYLPLNICKENDLKIEYDPFRIIFKDRLKKEYILANSYKYDLKIDNNIVEVKKELTDEIAISSSYYEANHIIEVLVYNNNLEYVGKYELNSKKLDPIILPLDKIEMKINSNSIFEIDFKYLDLIECESEYITYDNENEIIKAVKAGSGEAVFRVKDTNIEVVIPVTITDPNAKKTGCAESFVLIMNAFMLFAYLVIKRKGF